MWACNFYLCWICLYALRVLVELKILACLFCKILIAHCIYEGSLKKWNRDLWDLMKKASVCIWNPSQCADDVSTVIGVSVVNELPDIQFFTPFSLPLPVVDTSFTWGSNSVHEPQQVASDATLWAALYDQSSAYCKTLDRFFLHCLVKCRFCMPSYNVKWITFGEGSW